MKKQISTPKWVKSTLTVVSMALISFSSFGQGGPGGGGPGHGGGGPGHGGGGPGHGGGPGGGNPGGHPTLTCNADFASRRDTITNGVRFYNRPGTGAATYAWDFGDGSTGTGANPSHVYADTGWYYVCLTVTDTIGGGCSDTDCDSIHVFTPAPHCNAHFSARKDSVPNSVRFRAGGRHFHRPSTSATYAWDFGDGNTSTDPNPTHAYSAAGTYYVCLTVSKTTAGGSCTDTFCDSVNTDSLRGGHHHHHHMIAPEDNSPEMKLSNTSNTSKASASVYPNPMVESTTIHIENTSGNVTFRVYNSTGQVAFTQQLGNGDYTISRDKLSEGLYFYSVDDGNTNVAKGKLRVY